MDDRVSTTRPGDTPVAGDLPRRGPGRIRRLAAWLAGLPRYRYVQVTILVVLAIAFVTSFSSGSEGARTSGYPAQFQAAFPLVCDIVAALATLMHGWARFDPKMRRLAALYVMGPMLLSWAANAVSHLGNAGITAFGDTRAAQAWTLWVILAAGLCPVAVAALLYVATKFAEFEQRLATTGTKVETVVAETPPPVEDEPEFIEPARSLIVSTRVAPPANKVPEPAKPILHSVPEIEEDAVVRVMQKHSVRREIAEIMVRDGCSRAVAYRRRAKTG